MTLRRWLAISHAIVLAIGLAGCTEGGPQSCRIDRLADLPLVPGAPFPAVQASLDGQKVLVYIDTGAASSVIARQAADHFHLPSVPGDRIIRLNGVGGSVFATFVTVHHLILGHGIARDLELPVAGDLGGPIGGIPVFGLFGADFLANYDVDLNLPGHHFALYALRQCGSNLQPLDPPSFEMPFRLDNTRIMIEPELNGRPVRAFLDSGATHSLVPLAMARRAGVSALAMTGDRTAGMQGIDENRLKASVHRFASLRIGPESLNNFLFAIADADLDDMILGGDFLRFNEVWISYKLRRLFIRPSIENPAVHVHP